jgi:hypothetical protein
VTAVHDIPRSVRWTVPLSLLGPALAVPFSAPDGTGMQWDELVLGGAAAARAAASRTTSPSTTSTTSPPASPVPAV